MTDATCAVADCDRPTYVRGWCTTHYQRWQKHGDPETIVRVVKPAECSVDDCAKPVDARGLCKSHVYRLRKHGDPLAGGTFTRKGAQCTAPGCVAAVKASNLCNSHYQAHLIERDPHYGERRAAATIAYGYTKRRKSFGLPVFIDEIVDPTVIYRRDAGLCGLCHEPVDLALKWPDPFSLSIDHIIPVIDPRSRHSYENVQLAHLQCNSRKNRTVPNDADGLGVRG